MRMASKNRNGSKYRSVKYRTRNSNKNKNFTQLTKSQSSCCRKHVNKFNYLGKSSVYCKHYSSSQSTEVFPERINVPRLFRCNRKDTLINEEFSEVEQRVINYSEYKVCSERGDNSFIKTPVLRSYNRHQKLSKEKYLTKEKLWQVKECIELVKKIKDSKCFAKESEGGRKIDKILSLVSNGNIFDKNHNKLMNECAELAEIIKDFFERNGFPMNKLYSLLQDNNISTKYKFKQIGEPLETVKGSNESDSLTMKQNVEYTELVHNVKSSKEEQHEINTSKTLEDKYKILEKNTVSAIEITKQCEETTQIQYSTLENTKEVDSTLKTIQYFQVTKIMKGILDYINIFKICSKEKATNRHSKEKRHESSDIQAVFKNQNSNFVLDKEEILDGEKSDKKIMARKFEEEKSETIQKIQNCFPVQVSPSELARQCLDDKFSHNKVPAEDVNTQLITSTKTEVTAVKSEEPDNSECSCSECNKMRKRDESPELLTIIKYCQRNPGYRRRRENWYPLPPKYIPTHPLVVIKNMYNS